MVECTDYWIRNKSFQVIPPIFSFIYVTGMREMKSTNNIASGRDLYTKM